MKDAAKHVLKRKAEMESKRNIHDVAAVSVEVGKEIAKEQGKEYSREDANKDRMNALLAMQGINRED